MSPCLVRQNVPTGRYRGGHGRRSILQEDAERFKIAETQINAESGTEAFEIDQKNRTDINHRESHEPLVDRLEQISTYFVCLNDCNTLTFRTFA